MRLSSKSEYALLALVYLARQEEGQRVTVENIAKAQGIPRQFLEQILLALKHARYVRSTQGQRGGYCLAKPAGKIALAEIVRLLDGPIAPTDSVSRYFYASTPIEREKRLVRLFREIRNMVARKLEQTTVADVL
jgi:Rrf2 family protein